jgi:mono/diheme cytochrome c family protein
MMPIGQALGRVGALLLVFLAVHPVPAQDQSGRSIFEAQCSSCHTIGGGEGVGPDLAGLSARRKPAWILAFIRAPDLLFRDKDPEALALLQKYQGLPMPNLGLSEDEVRAVALFLGQPPNAANEAGRSAAEEGEGKGEVAVGRSLFTGSKGFWAGGSSCLACHNVAGLGFLGGGSLGPDLTGAAKRYGATGLAAALGALPFPTMRPIYRDRPFDPGEIADLVAFLRDPGGGPVQDATLPFLSFGVEGLVAVYLLLMLPWSRRLRRLRISLSSEDSDGLDQGSRPT